MFSKSNIILPLFMFFSTLAALSVQSKDLILLIVVFWGGGLGYLWFMKKQRHPVTQEQSILMVGSVLIFILLFRAHLSWHTRLETLDSLVPSDSRSVTLTGRIIAMPQQDVDGPILIRTHEGHVFSLSSQKISLEKALDFDRYYQVSGTYFFPEKATNPGQYDAYTSALIQNRYGRLSVSKVVPLPRQGHAYFSRLIRRIQGQLLTVSTPLFSAEHRAAFLGMIFGIPVQDLETFELKAVFKQSGLLHLLVASGSQISLLTGSIVLIGQTLKWHRVAILCMSVVINVGFFILSGGGVSLTRALLMNLFMTSMWSMQRQMRIDQALYLTGTVLLFLNPLWILDKGMQLSFLATASLVLGVNAFEGFWKQGAATLIAPSLFTLPVLWGFFYEVQWVSLLSNLVVLPWVEAIVVFGFISAFLMLLGFSWDSLNFVISELIRMVIWICRFFADIPFGSVFVKSPHWSLVFFFFVILGYGIYGKQKKVVGLWLLTCWLLLSIGSVFLPKPLKLTFLDVGQGDAIVIQTPNRRTYLIDTGPNTTWFHASGRGRDAAQHVIVPYLKHEGINTIEGIFLSHFDTDHIGGTPYLGTHLPVEVIYIPPQNNPHIKKFNEIRHIPSVTLNAGHTLCLDTDLFLDVLQPFDEMHDEDKNNGSLVLLLRYKTQKILFTGDIEKKAEAIFYATYPRLDIDVLKVAHHGSKTSSTAPFLCSLKPEHAVISVGRRNRYHHPSQEVVDRLNGFKIQVFRTDQSGAIQLVSNGKCIQFFPFLSR